MHRQRRGGVCLFSKRSAPFHSHSTRANRQRALPFHEQVCGPLRQRSTKSPLALRQFRLAASHTPQARDGRTETDAG